MEIKTTQITIPEQVTTANIYVAIDGKEFLYERDCLNYERKLDYNKYPVIKNRINKGIQTFDNFNATLYYVESAEDVELITAFENCHRFEIEDSFEQYGKGLYIYWRDDLGDYTFNYLCHYDTYVKEHRGEIEDVIQNNLQAINNSLAQHTD